MRKILSSPLSCFPVRYVLCVSLEHPERHLAADVKQPDNRILTSRHQQLTVRPEPAAVCSVLKPCECLHRLLGEWPVNVDLEQKQCDVKFQQTFKSSKDKLEAKLLCSISEAINVPLWMLSQQNYVAQLERHLCLWLLQILWSGWEAIKKDY